MESSPPSTAAFELNRDDRVRLRRVAMLHYIPGGFFLIAAMFFAAAMGVGIWVVVAKPPQASEPGMVANAQLLIALSAIMAISCLVPAVMLILLGWLFVRCKAYRLCMWLTGMQCVILFPFGPMLGVYVYKVAHRPAVKAKFDANAKTGKQSIA